MLVLSIIERANFPFARSLQSLLILNRIKWRFSCCWCCCCCVGGGGHCRKVWQCSVVLCLPEQQQQQPTSSQLSIRARPGQRQPSMNYQWISAMNYHHHQHQSVCCSVVQLCQLAHCTIFPRAFCGADLIPLCLLPYSLFLVLHTLIFSLCFGPNDCGWLS